MAKLTESYLRKVIKEELRKVLNEGMQRVTAQALINALQQAGANELAQKFEKIGNYGTTIMGDRIAKVYELNERPDLKVVQVYSGANFIDDIPMDVYKRLSL
jgi:hypothetical protein